MAGQTAAHSCITIKLRVHSILDNPPPPPSEGVAALLFVSGHKKPDPFLPGLSKDNCTSDLLANVLSQFQVEDGIVNDICHIAHNCENSEIMQNDYKTKLLELVLDRMASLVLELEQSQLELQVTKEELRYERGS